MDDPSMEWFKRVESIHKLSGNNVVLDLSRNETVTHFSQFKYCPGFSKFI